MNLVSRIEGKTKELEWPLLIPQATQELLAGRIETRDHPGVIHVT